MKLQSMALLSTLALFSCKNTDVNTPKEPDAKTIENSENQYLDELSRISLKTSTPDEAVKSFYEFLNKSKEFNCRFKFKIDKNELTRRSYEESFLDDSFLRHVKKLHSDETLEDCLKTAYKRSVEISEVKIETPTRAIVFATIRNITNIPEGAEPSEKHMEWRKEGENYKYEMTNIKGKWKIQQIYEKNILDDYKWTARFNPDEAPDIPFFVSYYY